MNIRKIAGFVAVTVLATASTVSAEPLKLRMDWGVVPGHFAPLIPTVSKYNPNVLRHYGKSYIIEPTRIIGGGASLTALAADQIDIGAQTTAQSLVHAVTEAKLDVRLIAQGLTSEYPGYFTSQFWVRKSEVKSIADLRGKVIAVNARGANVDAVAKIIMARAGMQEPRDFQIAEIRFPAMVPALESKRVDAAPLPPPFNRMAARNAELAPLFSVGDVFGPIEAIVFMVKTDLIKKHRAALVDFLEDHIRMRRWMTDPKTRMEAVRQVADTAKIPESEFADWVYTNEDYYFHPQARVDVDRVQSNIRTLKEAGIVSTEIDVKQHVDLSLVEEAAARVKD